MSLSHKTHLYFLNNKKKKLSNALLFMTTIKKSLNSSKILTIYNPTTIITNNNNKHSFHFNIYQTKTTQSNPNQTTINHHFENNSKNNTDNSKNNNNNTDNSNHNNSDTINNNNNNNKTKNNKTILIIFFLLFSGILAYHYFTSLKIEKKLKQFISIQTESDYLNLLNELNENLKEKLIKLNVKIVNSKKNNLQFHSEIKNLMENEKDILTLTNDVIFYYFIVQQIVKSNKKTENKNILQYVIVKKDLEFEFKEAKDYNSIDDKYIDYNKDYNEDYNSEDYSQLTNEEKKLNLIKNLKIEPFNDISSNLTDLLNKTLQENTMTLFTKSTVTKLSNYTTNKLLEFIKESKQPLFIEINNNNSTNNNVSDNNEYEIKEIKRELNFTTDIHTTLYTSNNNFNNYNNNMNLYTSDKNNNLNKEIISSIEYRIIQGRILKDDPIYCYGKIKRNVDNNTTANVNFNDDDNNNNTIYSSSNDNNDSGESDNIVDNNNSYNSKNNNSYGNISGNVSGAEERKEFSFIPLIVMSGKDDSNLKQTLKLERTSSEVMFLIGSAIFLYAFFK